MVLGATQRDRSSYGQYTEYNGQYTEYNGQYTEYNGQYTQYNGLFALLIRILET